MIFYNNAVIAKELAGLSARRATIIRIMLTTMVLRERQLPTTRDRDFDTTLAEIAVAEELSKLSERGPRIMTEATIRLTARDILTKARVR